MTPSRARGRKVCQGWGVFNGGRLYVDSWGNAGIFSTRRQARFYNRGAAHPVTITCTVPTKPKPRKAK